MTSIHSHADDCYPEIKEALASKHLMAVSDQLVQEDEFESAWTDYIAARGELVRATSARIMNVVASHLPDVKWVVLYEDRSHDAPHGHVEAVLDANGNNLVKSLGHDWHDLDWTHDIDEWVWDLYHLSSENFMKMGSRRRFIIVRGE